MITAQQVMALRDKTGVAMMAVKRALEEAGGDEDKAIEILRKRGEAKSSEKSDRTVREGVVALEIEGGKAAIVSIRCETDFVARNEEFQKIADDAAKDLLSQGESVKEGIEAKLKEAVNKLGENIQFGECKLFTAPVIGGYVHLNRKIGVLIGLEGGTVDQARDVAMHAAAMNPKVISPEELAEEILAKEKEIWTEQLAKEGKPENIRANIMKGKEKKFREEHALVSQVFVKDNSKTVGQYLSGAKVVGYIRMTI